MTKIKWFQFLFYTIFDFSHYHSSPIKVQWEQGINLCRMMLLIWLYLFGRSVSDGYCGFTHEGWYRTNEQHSPYGPSGDHTNGTSKYL